MHVFTLEKPYVSLFFKSVRRNRAGSIVAQGQILASHGFYVPPGLALVPRPYEHLMYVVWSCICYMCTIRSIIVPTPLYLDFFSSYFAFFPSCCCSRMFRRVYAS